MLNVPIRTKALSELNKIQRLAASRDHRNGDNKFAPDIRSSGVDVEWVLDNLRTQSLSGFGHLPVDDQQGLIGIMRYLGRTGGITPEQAKYVQTVLQLKKFSLPKVTKTARQGKRVAFQFEEVSDELLKRIDAIPSAWFDETTGTGYADIAQHKVLSTLGIGIPPEYDYLPPIQQASRAPVRPSFQKIMELSGLKGTPYPYQIEGIQWLEEHGGRGLIGDQPGLGKSLQATGWLQLHRHDALPALIVCPASIKENWRREIQKWSQIEDVQILEGLKPYAIDADVVIVNYDVLVHKQGGWLEKLKSYGFRTIVADEIHRVSNYKTQSTKAMRELSDEVDYFIGLTGTPIQNKPIELYMPLRMIKRGHLPDYYAYVVRYCDGHQEWIKTRNKEGKVVARQILKKDGVSNIAELNGLLKDVMIRRLKKDVLKDLPAKSMSPQYLPLNNDEYRKALAVFKQTEAENALAMVGQLSALRQAAVAAKKQAVIEWVHDFMSSGEKLVLFAWHRKTLDMLSAAFKEYNPVRIDGSIPSEERAAIVDRFQTDASCRLFIGQIKATGTGVDGLQHVCSDAAFVELDWTPAMMEQASDRIHRIGQLKSVMIWLLMGAGTIDEHILSINEKKQTVIGGVVDGEFADEDVNVKTLYNEMKRAARS